MWHAATNCMQNDGRQWGHVKKCDTFMMEGWMVGKGMGRGEAEKLRRVMARWNCQGIVNVIICHNVREATLGEEECWVKRG